MKTKDTLATDVISDVKKQKNRWRTALFCVAAVNAVLIALVVKKKGGLPCIKI